MTTIKDVRIGLVSLLSETLDNVEIWPGLLAEVPHLPAIIIRRGPYKTDEYFGEGDPDVSFDLICCTELFGPGRTQDMDDLVTETVDLIRLNRDIEGIVADTQVIGVGHEERVPQGGPANRPMLAVPISIKVVQF